MTSAKQSGKDKGCSGTGGKRAASEEHHELPAKKLKEGKGNSQSSHSQSSFEPLPEEAFEPYKLAATKFGIELEFNLVFHEDLLKGALQKYNIPYISIQKQHLPDQHEQLLADAFDAASARRKIYPSWALRTAYDPDQVPEDSHLALLKGKAHGSLTVSGREQKICIRRYLVEPLLMALDVLGSQKLEADVRAQMRGLHPYKEEVALPYHPKVLLRTTKADKSKWTLTNDHTLLGSLDSQLMERFPQKIRPDNIQDWDSFGVELVSPVFELDKKADALDAISKYLEALQGCETHDLISSKWAGLHVHIGFNADFENDITLPLLQHLCLILLAQEPTISECFPRDRSGLADNSAGSPVADSDDAVLEMEKRYTGADNVKSNARYFAASNHVDYPPSKEDLAQRLLRTGQNINLFWDLVQGPGTDRHGNRHGQLGERDRAFKYNFNNLRNFTLDNEDTWKEKKPTVEFRQHECCIDARKIGSWVRLLERIFKKAEEMNDMQPATGADESEKQLGKYPAEFPYSDMRDLCRWLGLDDKDTMYWVERQAQYRDIYRKTV